MGVENWLFGGDASSQVNPNLQHGGFLGGYLQNNIGQGQGAPQAQAAQLGRASQLNLGANGQIDPRMMGLADRLGAIGTGQAKGAGELAVGRQFGAATAAQQAQARMARGANAALAARQAARNTSDLGVAAAGQSQIAALQDQTQANQALGGLLGGMRGQNIDVANANAQLSQQQMLAQGGFNQQTGLANQQAILGQRGLNQQRELGMLAQLLGLDQAQLQAQLAAFQAQNADQGHIGALLQGAAGIGAAYAGGPA